jgi:hypothetical protein
MYPRLNNQGHKFRRLGYRMPDEFTKQESTISWDELKQLGNYFAARGRPRVVFANTDSNGDSDRENNFDFQMHDVTLFYTGPVSKNLSFFFELPFEGEEVFLEVGNVQLNWGKPDGYCFVKAGQFHQFAKVGAGGLDRPITIARPQLFSKAINGFVPWIDGLGVETGYSTGNFTWLVQFTNGLNANGSDATLGSDDNNHKDIGVLFEYLVPDTEASASLLYVYGRAPIPEDINGTAVTGADNTIYNRIYVFGDYTLEEFGLKPVVGFGIGIDNQYLTNIGALNAALVSADNSTSWGWFVELDKELTDTSYAVARFDQIDLSNKATNERSWALTASLTKTFYNFLRPTMEYQVSDTQATTSGVAHSVTGELQFNF